MIRTKEDIVNAYELWVYSQLGRLVSSQTTNVGSFISTDGINLIWSGGGSSLPSQSGNAGKFLTTDGTNTSWGTVTAPVWGAITGTLSSQTDLQTALNAKESTSNKGAVNGYASLDGSGLVPSSQLPSYVDDVLEYANLAAFPVTGTTGKIYIALDTNFVYRWSGSTYVQITSATVGGSNTHVQFNNNGVLGGSANATWNGTGLNIGQNVSGSGTERLLIKTSSTGNSNIAIDIRTSANAQAFAVKDAGQILFTSFSALGGASTDFYGGTSIDDRGFYFTGSSSTNSTSGARGVVAIGNTFDPTSGTATHNTLKIASTVNQTGGASGITRGIYVNETLTAAANYRSIEAIGPKAVFALAASPTLADSSVQYNFIGTSSDARIGAYTTGRKGVFLGAASNNAGLYAYDYGAGAATTLAINQFGGTVSVGTNAVVSTPILTSTGTWFTGGTTTTTKPHWLIEPAGTTSTGWSTSGTGLGLNSASGFTGNLIDLQVNGSRKFYLDAFGNIGSTGTGFLDGGLIFGTAGSRSRITNSSDGVFVLLDNAGTNFGRLQFGGTTSSFPALKRSSATIQARLADDSDFAAVQSLYQRFGSGSPESVVTAPVGAIYHRTDGGANTSLYVKESGSGNTGWIAK